MANLVGGLKASLTHGTTPGVWDILNGSPRIYVILTRSELLFIYKMIQEIISIPRADSGYSHNFMVNSWVFKDDESKSEVKTISRPRVCPLLVESPHFACVKPAQCPLLVHCVRAHCARAHTHTHTHTHTYTHTHTPLYATSPPRADLNYTLYWKGWIINISMVST